MKTLQTTDLRHRITIRRATETDNGKGGYTTTWDDLVSVYAEVAGLNGRESVMDQALQGISTYQVRIRWRADISEADQLRSASSCFGGKDVNIRSIVDPDGRREQLVIIADTASTRS